MKQKRSLLKRLLRSALFIVLSFIAFVALYWVTELGLSNITVAKEKGQPDEMTIYIINNGAHTDIVMPVKSAWVDWSTLLPYSDTKGNDTSKQFIGMGWGDKGFYLETETWAELKPRVAFNAVFGLGNTAMHTTYYRSLQPGERCRAINLSQQQYQKLVNYILASFETDAAGKFKYVETDKQYGQDDAFYDAKGSYSMLHTCNTWANNGLKASGLKACYWTAFYKGIFKKYPL